MYAHYGTMTLCMHHMALLTLCMHLMLCVFAFHACEFYVNYMCFYILPNLENVRNSKKTKKCAKWLRLRRRHSPRGIARCAQEPPRVQTCAKLLRVRRWHSPRGIAKYAQGAPRVQNGPNGTGLRRRCAPRRIVRQGRPGRATCGRTLTVCPSAYRAPGSPRS
jgi:ribosomal protein L30/L7E